MRLSLFIAWRYLFSKKKQNAINIISAISVVGVTVGTTALIVVLSVFNGMDMLLQESTDSFTPDLVVFPAEGKYAVFDSAFCNRLEASPDIASCHQVIEEKALARYGDYTTPVVVKGVDGAYLEDSGFAAHILDGVPVLKSSDGYEALLGYGVAAQLRLSLSSLRPLVCYYPDKNAAPTVAALNTRPIYPAAFFSVQQEIDDRYIVADLQFARDLFKTGDKVSKMELRLVNPDRLQEVKEQVSVLAGSNYRVEDKYELNGAFYAMMKAEKLAVFFILLFILLIASFNIVGSISMLILDKMKDLQTYRALGMTRKGLVSVFRTEGCLITIGGALLGLILGTGICFIQEKYGIVTLGSGSYIVDAYPVQLVAGDVVAVMAAVLAIGYAASCFPVHYLIKRFTLESKK